MADGTEHKNPAIVDKNCFSKQESRVESLVRKKDRNHHGWFYRFFHKERAGHYVAMASLNDTTPIAEGTDFDAVCEEAKSKGVDNPIFDYTPSEELILGLGHAE